MKDEKEVQAPDAPSIVAGNSTGEYEYSAPIAYDGSTGEYEFGVLHDKKTGEHLREVSLAADDDDDVGSTLLMDKPNIEKTVAPQNAALAEHEKMKSVVRESIETYLQRNPAIAVLTAIWILVTIAFLYVLFGHPFPLPP